MKKVINTIPLGRWWVALIVGSLLFVVAGCPNFHDAKDLIHYVKNKENGLRKTVTVGNFEFTVQYKPAEYILETEHLATAAARQKRAKQLDSMVWFDVSIQIKGYNQSPLRYKVDGLPGYNARLDYYLNKASGDYYLVCGNDSLYPSAYWFINSQNLGDRETMIVGFRLPHGRLPEADLHLAYYDRVFENGIIKTIIRKKDVDRIPPII